MLSLLKSSWNKVREELRRRAGDAVFEAWLASLRPVLMERGVVFLEVEGRMACDRVRRLFRPMVQEVLSGELGAEVQIEVRQAASGKDLDALEVSPQRPVIDEGNRTMFLALKSLLPGGSREGVVPGHLFLFHGPSGVGKTFLLRWWLDRSPARPVAFDLLRLLKAFQAAHLERRVEGLREELSVERPLILDEAHRVSGKPALQSFLLDVLSERIEKGRKTLLASRWHPKEIHDLDPGLCSVLLSGFVAAVAPPGPIGRLRYLRALEGAPSRNGRAPEIEDLAQRLSGSYSEIRSAYKAQRAFGVPPRYLELVDPARTFRRLLARVSERTKVSPEELAGKGQSRRVSAARKVLAYLCVQEGLSRAEIGRFMGKRTRAAVSYMTRSLESSMARSTEIRQMVEGML
ncbi:MAG: chromosomal replication initiator protein DnaA [Planctomycetota bacterium]